MQLLAYVQSGRITGWKNMIHGKWSGPMVYGSKDKTSFTLLERGDVLWIIASSPGRSPSLVAKIVVRDSGGMDCPEIREHTNAMMLLKDEEGRFPWIVTGGEGSSFFGINDAARSLLDLKLETSTGSPINFAAESGRWDSKFGHHLQRPVRISQSGERNALELLAEQCARKTIFLSWKHADHPYGRFPREIAHALVRRGLPVWFDKLTLPPSMYTESIVSDPNVISNLLEYGYRQSHILLAIDSRHYGTQTQGNERPGIKKPKSDRNWTLDEWNGTFRPNGGMLRLCVASPEKTKSAFTESADHIIPHGSPDEIAARVAKLIP